MPGAHAGLTREGGGSPAVCGRPPSPGWHLARPSLLGRYSLRLTVYPGQHSFQSGVYLQNPCGKLGNVPPNIRSQWVSQGRVPVRPHGSPCDGRPTTGLSGLLQRTHSGLHTERGVRFRKRRRGDSRRGWTDTARRPGGHRQRVGRRWGLGTGMDPPGASVSPAGSSSLRPRGPHVVCVRG